MLNGETFQDEVLVRMAVEAEAEEDDQQQLQEVSVQEIRGRGQLV